MRAAHPAAGASPMERYRRERVIGKGAFGSALLVTDRHSGSKYVIKQVDVSKMGPRERDDAKKEVKLLGSFKHPNIVRYRESFIDQGMLCIVMDYADGGDLHQLLQEQRGVHLPQERVLDLFVQICLALKHIHDRKVLHRDLKSQNVFLTSNRRIVKLGDFGIARVLTSTRELARTQRSRTSSRRARCRPSPRARPPLTARRPRLPPPAPQARRAARPTTCRPRSVTAVRTMTNRTSGHSAACSTRCSR